MLFPRVPNHLYRQITSRKSLSPWTFGNVRELEPVRSIYKTRPKKHLLRLLVGLKELALRGDPFIQTLYGDTFSTGRNFFVASLEQPWGRSPNRRKPSYLQVPVSLPHLFPSSSSHGRAPDSANNLCLKSHQDGRASLLAESVPIPTRLLGQISSLDTVFITGA